MAELSEASNPAIGTEIIQRTLAFLENDRSPLVRTIEAWARAHCDQFDHVAARASSADPTVEMPIWCHELHQEYTEFIEAKLDESLRINERGGAAALLEAVRAHPSGIGDELCRAIDALCNFDVFVQMMKDAREDVYCDRK
jgi:hypothetical protein